MSKVSQLAKMWEKKGQQDKQDADKMKKSLPPPSQPQKSNPGNHPITKPQSFSQPQKNKPSTHQNISELPQRFTFLPPPQKTQTNPSKQGIKSQLQKRLKLGGTIMSSENAYLNRPSNIPKKQEVRNADSVVESESSNFKSNKDQLQNFFKKKSAPSEENHQKEESHQNQDSERIVIPQTQYTYGEYNQEAEIIKEEKQEKQGIPQYKQQVSSFLPESHTVTKSELGVRKPKNKPTRATHIGVFEDSD